MYAEGTLVSYKGIQGVVSFCSKKYVSILIKEGKHRSQDVKIVIYRENYNEISMEIVGKGIRRKGT